MTKAPTYRDRLNDQLSRYKEDTLKILESGTWWSNGKPYPHILPKQEKEQNLLPVYRDLCWNYIQHSNPRITLHTDFSHLNSSQAMCFNLFFPFMANEYALMPLLLETLALPDCKVAAQFEKVLDPEENTNFDFYLESQGTPLAFFETRLSEARFAAANKTEREKYAGKFERFYRPALTGIIDPKWLEYETFVANYQILRNISYLGRYPGSQLYFIFPKANESLRKDENTIRDIMAPFLTKRVTIIHLECLVKRLVGGGENVSAEYRSHIEEFAQKYVIGQSDPDTVQAADGTVSIPEAQPEQPIEIPREAELSEPGQMKLKERPSRLNQARRMVLGFVLSAMVLFIFAHNPISGYTIDRSVTESIPIPECSDREKQKYREYLTLYYDSETGKGLKEEAEKTEGIAKVIDRRVEQCRSTGSGWVTEDKVMMESKRIPRPFNDWESKKPLVLWFGSVLNFVYSLLATVIIGMIFSLIVFTNKDPD